MKLIIDIPEEDRKDIGNIHFVREDLKFKIGKAIMNGTPLDDVKAEIEKEENIWYHDCEPENDWKKFDVIRVDTVFEILDHISKTESEDIL